MRFSNANFMFTYENYPEIEDFFLEFPLALSNILYKECLCSTTTSTILEIDLK